MSNESLSALFDGECTDAELEHLLDEAERSPLIAERWSRYWLTREAMEGTRIVKGQADIAACVMRAIAEEPVLARHGKVVELSAWRSRTAAYLKPAAGFAAAASMGAAAVLFIGRSEEAAQDVGAAASLPAAPAAAGSQVAWRPLSTPTVGSDAASALLQPVSATSADLAGEWPSWDSEYAVQLREYLIDHSSAASQQGIGATLGYARFAAYTAEMPAATTVPAADERP